jgi:hypothetical protein
VTAGGTLTSGAIVTGAGGTAVQTPSSAASVDSSGIVSASNYRDVVSVLTYNGTTMAIDFAGDGIKTVAVTNGGNCTFTTSNKAAGRKILLVIDNTANSSATTFTLPSWLFLGAAAPTTLAAGKTAVFTLICTSTTDATVLAEYGAQP